MICVHPDYQCDNEDCKDMFNVGIWSPGTFGHTGLNGLPIFYFPGQIILMAIRISLFLISNSHPDFTI